MALETEEWEREKNEDLTLYKISLGQTWWTAKRSNETVYRPHLFGTDGLAGGSVSGLNMKNSPMWFNFIMNSSDVLITDINIWLEVTNSSSPPAVSS